MPCFPTVHNVFTEPECGDQDKELSIPELFKKVIFPLHFNSNHDMDNRSKEVLTPKAHIGLIIVIYWN